MSSNGIKVTVEDCKCVQANAFVQAGIFQDYSFKEESASFRVNLAVLMVSNSSSLSRKKKRGWRLGRREQETLKQLEYFFR